MNKKSDSADVVRRKRLGYRFSASAWATGAGGMTLDIWQVKALQSQKPRIAVLACRQAGKSTVSAVKASWTAVLDKPGSTSVMVAPGQRQSALLLSRAKDFLRKIPPEYSSKIDQISESRLVFENGSQIVALPGANPDSLRGFSIDGALIVDEASWALEDDGDGEGGGSELLAAVMPALSVAGGKAVFISSAGMEACLYHRIIAEGYGSFEVHNVGVDDVPRLTEEIVDAMREVLSPQQFEREVLNRWGATDVAAMDVAAFRAAASPGPSVDMGPLIMV